MSFDLVINAGSVFLSVVEYLLKSNEGGTPGSGYALCLCTLLLGSLALEGL